MRNPDRRLGIVPRDIQENQLQDFEWELVQRGYYTPQRGTALNQTITLSFALFESLVELGNVGLGLTDVLIDRREKSVNCIPGMSGWSNICAQQMRDGTEVRFCHSVCVVANVEHSRRK